MSDAFECDGCGLCCSSLIIEADAADVLREPRIHERTKHMNGGRTPLLDSAWFLYDKETKSCPFLDKDKRCEIYPTRPGCCVRFQAGSKQCQELRSTHGLQPLAPLIQVTNRKRSVSHRINAEFVAGEEDD